MVLYLRYSGKKQLPDIPINLFYYCNLTIMIMNLFFLYVRYSRSLFTGVKDFRLRVQCGLAANAAYRLFFI